MSCIGKFFKKRGFNPTPISSSIPKDKATVVENPNANTGRYIHKSEQVYTPIQENYSNTGENNHKNYKNNKNGRDSGVQVDEPDGQQQNTRNQQSGEGSSSISGGSNRMHGSNRANSILNPEEPEKKYSKRFILS